MGSLLIPQVSLSCRPVMDPSTSTPAQGPAQAQALGKRLRRSHSIASSPSEDEPELIMGHSSSSSPVSSISLSSKRPSKPDKIAKPSDPPCQELWKIAPNCTIIDQNKKRRIHQTSNHKDASLLAEQPLRNESVMSPHPLQIEKHCKFAKAG